MEHVNIKPSHLCLLGILVRFLNFESIKELMSKLKVAHCAVQCTCEPILQQVSDCKHLVVFIIAGLMFDGRHNNHQWSPVCWTPPNCKQNNSCKLTTDLQIPRCWPAVCKLNDNRADLFLLSAQPSSPAAARHTRLLSRALKELSRRFHNHNHGPYLWPLHWRPNYMST